MTRIEGYLRNKISAFNKQKFASLFSQQLTSGGNLYFVKFKKCLNLLKILLYFQANSKTVYYFYDGQFLFFQLEEI